MPRLPHLIQTRRHVVCYHRYHCSTFLALLDTSDIALHQPLMVVPHYVTEESVGARMDESPLGTCRWFWQICEAVIVIVMVFATL